MSHCKKNVNSKGFEVRHRSFERETGCIIGISPCVFFSNIPSVKQLTRVISLISEMAQAGKKTAQSKESDEDTAILVWALYKHNDESKKKKEDERVQGNHVRNVFAPLAKNLRRLEEKMDLQNTDKLNRLGKVEKEIMEISKKMDQLLKKFERQEV